MRAHPHLYEINTWPWLERLSRREGRHVTIGSVPDAEWDALRARGIDLVYLMGIWRRSGVGRGIARADVHVFEDYRRANPGWRVQDVVGSAYSIRAYEPDPRIGSMEDLHHARAALRARGMRLIVDFVPNHLAFDHSWIADHPDRFVNAPEDRFKSDPSSFRAIELPSGELRFIACARDPYFPAWSDVAQLDYSRDETREAMLAILAAVASIADGARCDMAMLVLSDIFETTWRGLAAEPRPAREFWADARAAVPGFLLLAEVYWDLEWRLQQIGFDYTYDKRLYDRMLHDGGDAVRSHLEADAEYQRKSARFIENHDETRSAEAFGPRAPAAAVAMSTLQGLRFYYDGQLEGRRVRLPVQLGVDVEESPNIELSRLYDRLLTVVDSKVFHEGRWTLLDIRSTDESSSNLVAWSWTHEADRRIVVVNPGAVVSQGIVAVGGGIPADLGEVSLEDLLDGRVYVREARDLAEHGLFVRLQIGQAHILAATAR